MSKPIFVLLSVLFFSSVQASVLVGKTGTFDKFRESKHGLSINKSTTRVRIEATRKIYVRECQIVFGNGHKRILHVGKLLKGKASHSFYFKRDRLVKRIVCFGSTNSAAKKLAKLKVFIIPKGGLTPVVVGAGGVGGGVVIAKKVNLPSRRLNICVEKKKTILHLNTQARYWRINGAGSNLSTWKFRGSNATLTADYATANVVAYCRSRGSQVFNLNWMLNFNDPRKYFMNVRVNCIPCGDARAVANVKKKIDKANAALIQGKDKKAKRLLKEAQKMIDKLHEREVLTPKEEAIIDELEELIHQYHLELGGEVNDLEFEVEIEEEGTESDDEDEGLKKFLAIVGIIAEIASN